MCVPVASGWVEALVVGTAVKLVLYYWEAGSLVRKSITKVAQGDWMLGRVTESPGFSQQVFVLAYILYIITFHCFHLLTCSNLKSWVKESRTLKWAHVNKWAAGRIPDNLLWHAGDLRETSLRASKGFGWLLHILLPFQVEGQEVQYKLDETLCGVTKSCPLWKWWIRSLKTMRGSICHVLAERTGLQVLYGI